MYEFNLDSIGGFLAAVWDVIVGVLTLDPEVFVATINTPGAWTVALAVLFLAGVSDMLGQSVVLFANRVTPRRFVVSVIISAFMLVLSAVVWAFSIWLVVVFVFALEGRFSRIVILVALSYAPLILGFWSLLPYLGNTIYQFVRIWSLLALVVGVKAIAGALFWQGIIACLIGWLFVQLIIHMPIFKIKAVDAWLWKVMTGTSKRLDSQAIADQLAETRGKFFKRGNAG